MPQTTTCSVSVLPDCRIIGPRCLILPPRPSRPSVLRGPSVQAIRSAGSAATLRFRL